MSKPNFRSIRKAAVIQDANGKPIALGGYRADQKRSNVKKHRYNDNQNLPQAVDLRPYMTPVENQGASNSCTANAMAGAHEYLLKRLNGKVSDVSRLFIYYNARKLDGAIQVDEGSYLQSCVGVLQEYGACSEKTWPFNLDRILHAPNADAYEEASACLVQDAARVEVKLDAMRSCLAEGYPFTFGLMLFESFQQAGKTGLVPMPAIEQEKMDGGHAMLCVGYSDHDRVFIVRNSWGADWGDQGYCYIPYAYMTNPDLNGDCWTIRQTNATQDLSSGITSQRKSVFKNQAIAKVARNFQAPGAGLNPSCYDSLGTGYYTEVVYETEYIYDRTGNPVSIDQIDNLNALYYEESEYSIAYECYEYEYYEESTLEYWETLEYTEETTSEYSEEESEEYSEEESEEESEETNSEYSEEYSEEDEAAAESEAAADSEETTSEYDDESVDSEEDDESEDDEASADYDESNESEDEDSEESEDDEAAADYDESDESDNEDSEESEDEASADYDEDSDAGEAEGDYDEGGDEGGDEGADEGGDEGGDYEE